MLQAVTEAVGTIAVRDVSPPDAPASDEVVVCVERVGICGSDAHVFDGSHPYLAYPLVQGHEVAGIIEVAGTDVVGLSAGDRVVVDPISPCGDCVPCRHGRPNCCEHLNVVGITLAGGLAELLTIPARQAHKVDDMHPDAAIFVEPVAVAIRCLQRADLQLNEPVLVLGAGSLGRAIVVAAEARGARTIIADHAIERRQLATQLGANHAVDLQRRPLENALREFMDKDSCHVIVDTTGSGFWLAAALDLVAYGGTVVAVGISEESVSVPVALLSRKEISLHGARNSIDAFPDAIAAVRGKAVQLTRTISDRYALSDAALAIGMVGSRLATGKVLVDLSLTSSPAGR